MESQSVEEPLSQVFSRCSTVPETGSKRKPEEGFQHSPMEAPQAKKAPQVGYKDQSEPVSTSSPKRERQREETEPPSPMSRVQCLDKMQGAVTKGSQTKKTSQIKSDSQQARLWMPCLHQRTGSH